MNDATFTVTVSTLKPMDEETRGFCVGVMGNAVTELAREMGHDNAFVTIVDRGEE